MRKFTSVQRDEWDTRAELFGNRHPVIVRGNSNESAMAEVEANRALFRLLLEPKPSDALLEIGCGNALYLQDLATSVKTPVGLDLSLKMLQLARAGSLELAQGSADALPFGDESFDKLLNNGMIQYLPPKIVPAFFSEVRRVLKPGGLALISEIPLRWCLYGVHNRMVDIARNVKRGLLQRDPVIYSRFTPRDCARQLEAAGLRIVKHSTHQYSTGFGIGQRAVERCYRQGGFSPLFSSYYLFLCTR